ncbi:MAG: RNHCP domain-containing protein [Patescibacteria group bacterium]
MSFKRTKENFTCEHCGAQVKGNGYTNHCPKCLWSKHVDVNPGDRAETCGGMMEPLRIEGEAGTYRIVHHCTKCGIERATKAAADDDQEALLRCAQRAAEGMTKRGGMIV